MSRSVLLWAIAIGWGGCTEQPYRPKASDTQLAADRVPARTEDVVPASAHTDSHGITTDVGQMTFLGRRLAYWTQQARAGRREQPEGKIVAALTLALSSDVPEARVAAADALGALGVAAHPAIAALVAQLEHPVPWVRVAAMETLDGIGSPAVAELVRVVQTQSGGPPIRACIVLGSMGAEAKAAIPALKAMLRDETCAFRDQIPGVIQQIEADMAGQPPAAAGVGGLPEWAAAEPPHLTPGKSEPWPGFNGLRREAICAETGLFSQWPKEGPPLLWQTTGLGRGYSNVALAGGKILTMGDRQQDDATEIQQVIALDLATRKELWATSVGPPHEDGGPRCTPTVDGPRVYALGTEGDLLCLDAETGQVRWRRNLVDDFDGHMMSSWKYSESPLVDGPRLVCTPGGPEAGLVALDKLTGQLIWRCAIPRLGELGKDGAGYASMVVAEIHGVRQYIQLMGRGVVGVEAETGRFLWGYNRIANSIANIPSPVVRDRYVFVTTAYNTGCALLEILRHGGAFEPREVYFLPASEFSNHHGGVVVVGKYLYGGNGNNRGDPVCLDLTTGKIAWKQRAPARGSAGVLYADGHVLFRYDRGPVYLVEATPKAFRIKGSFTPLTGEGPAWAHPVVYDGKLWLRHHDLLLCYDLRNRETPPP